jgi:hypothetical protein
MEEMKMLFSCYLTRTFLSGHVPTKGYPAKKHWPHISRESSREAHLVFKCFQNMACSFDIVVQ